MTPSLHAAVAVTPPRGKPLPIVCDSPHSGTEYPADFRHALPRLLLRQGEDTHVAELWAGAPAHGATLIAARFPRTYIDPNRSLSDLDPELLDTPWPTPLNPGEKSHLGLGLVWRTLDRQPIYDRRLGVEEVQRRIEHCWKPYHEQLQLAIDASVETFGRVWHLNLHSMPNNAYERLGRLPPAPLADFVLGDRDGTTCDPAFVALVAGTLRGFGYSVAVNEPYKGVELIARIGRPAQGRHSLQIEIRRPLYMDEATREPNAGFMSVQAHLDQLLAVIADHVGCTLGA
ncbi:N-formylglutamate amidohydrolase [Schlegelella sp. S2-27]|uniref:N-formylglutamate amidohydrolase n=1 Tax=Caldimonas mangrovi TaxID=2944811 RepID=A0ABT0YSB1_9BURK|nr:N-formylglutamate amidohydrolase [Caldimonas mangrovi]MCM5680763.1 N-formylglutamate amidohydrolase [Caldimonas mangrovi]